MSDKTIDDVRAFWEANPLFTGETEHEPGTREYFEEHRQVIIDDCFAGRVDPRILPDEAHFEAVLDLGCGPGFWTIELARSGARSMTSADLTANALALAEKRAAIYEIEATFHQENAEAMTFEDGSFTHVNCQGVIHHTPDTEACVREIARVLKPGGTASISVYYKNIFLRGWPFLRWLSKLLHRSGAKLKGRGRENIYAADDINEIVRLYDGSENPIGKAYSRKEFVDMISPYMKVERTFLHFFPARSLPFPVPDWMHRWLDARAGFMIYASCRKPDS